MNVSYDRLYQAHKKLSWAYDPFGWYIFSKAQLEAKFIPVYDAELEAMHRELYPKRKKIVLANLPEDQVAPIRQRWQDKAMAYYKCAVGRYLWLGHKLNGLALSVELIPIADLRRVYDSRLSTYGSQGYGAAKYARNDCQSVADDLLRWGFCAEVRSVDGGFETWANAEDWQVDAASRRGYDLVTWATDCWRRGVNPQVDMPFLSDKIVDQSLENWRTGGTHA